LTTPLTPILAAEGAEFTVVNGWERVEYMKPSPDFEVTHGFGFDEAFDLVAKEVEMVQNGVGLAEVNGFNRIEISGSDAMSFMDRMVCGSLRERPGRVSLRYLLNHQGMVKGEATLAQIPASDRGPDRIWYGSAAASELHDMDWLCAHLRDDEDVSLSSLTCDYTILVLAGPKARDVLSAVSRGDWSKAAFPWMSVREAFIGIAPVTVMSVSFSGELAYELHIPNASLFAAYSALREAGKGHNMGLFGARAVESMRMEKGYLHWKADILTEFDPFETGLDMFVDLKKQEFIGREALMKRKEEGVRRSLVSLRVDTDRAPAHGGASVMVGDKVVGTVTSGEWGHRVSQNLAYAFVEPDLATPGQSFTIDISGEHVGATVSDLSPYDPKGERFRV